MGIPTATEIRTFLDGYNISASICPDAWIERRRDRFIIPLVERIIGRSVNAEDTNTEYVSGTGGPLIFLSARNITELVSLEYITGSGDVESNISVSSVELLDTEGIIKSVSNITEGGYSTLFMKGTKNIKVVYKVGGSITADLEEAITYLSAEQILGYVGARTGGGSINVQGFSRNFGERGRYQDLRNDLKRQAMALLKVYASAVVGR